MPKSHFLLMSTRSTCFIAAVFSVTCLFSQTAPKITTPKEALGFNLGDDYQMANYYPAAAVLEETAPSESDRMKLVDIGLYGRKAGPSTWPSSLRRRT